MNLKIHIVRARLAFACLLLMTVITAGAATVVPTDVQMPGTQPIDGVSPDSNRCSNCHGDYDLAAEPEHTWQGSMMGHAGRDPLFWATVAIAEQDFDGAGDLCIRCHTPRGWLEGRSTPTDGSALTDTDADFAVECDFCHRLTNPDNTEVPTGEQHAPFVAQSTAAHYGGSQYVIYDGSEKLGPYADDEARHGSIKYDYVRSARLCGTCHDVSNPVVGDLAPNNGAQVPLAAGTFNGSLGGSVSTKAAFNNPPHTYGVVERTFSEHQASWFGDTSNLVASYSSLPAELQAGSIQQAYVAATAGVPSGNYEDGDPRSFTCQTCHMRPANGAQGCNKNPRPRPDMPVHDLTGGNYWVPEVIKYMDGQGTLLLGSDLTTANILALDAGVVRAQDNLNNAGALSVSGNTLRVVNLTGHKLISGYPEGRRMWLNIKWFDSGNTLLREDGAYGTITADINGTPTQVETILDLGGSNTRIYEVHGAITQDWAAKLLAVDSNYAGVPVAFDRTTGAVVATIGDVAAQPPGTYHESFHFALNNKIASDTRIPPYGMRRDLATVRNILPVPPDQYGNPGPTGSYDYFDLVTLNPPAGATTATIELKYQPTSWEYIQFLYLANTGQNTFLANEGQNILDAWLNTAMAAPHVMASTAWTAPDSDTDGVIDSLDNCPTVSNASQLDTDADGQGDACDTDDDDDGLTDSEETAIGTDPLLADTDGDGLTDFAEVNYDGNPAYTPGQDLNPLSTNTDNDAYTDDIDPVPLTFNYDDGDLAPLGAPDGILNAGDLLVGLRIVLGLLTPTDLELAHGDLYPSGNPDGVIDLADLINLQKLVF